MEVSNEARMGVIADACNVAFDQAKQAWRAKLQAPTQAAAEAHEARRVFWIGIQSACSDELQDCAAAVAAGVP